jgi:dihydroflavonol-4-reductase
VVNATILTLLADLIKKPPLLGISRDQVRTMSEGWRLDGSKAERELGITYTPIRIAVEEAIASYRE